MLTRENAGLILSSRINVSTSTSLPSDICIMWSGIYLGGPYDRRKRWSSNKLASSAHDICADKIYNSTDGNVRRVYLVYDT